MRLRFVLLAGASLLTGAVVVPAQAAFKIGSGNTAVIEPPVSVPNELPCEVQLTTGVVFGANNADFSYTPPANCPGPWAKVVLSVDVAVTKGIQYDRTGTIWLGGVPLWFGTTSEPNPGLAPSWHFERDLTNYSALFKTPQSGFELITNYTNSTDNSLITSSAVLKFYMPTESFPAPATPDMVLPLSAPGGGTVGLNTGADVLSTTVTLPTNVKNATLDVYTQGQSGDEFWYFCVPNEYTNELESCGGGSLREGEITVDGTPAGVAPVYPWIFTGGIDPYLWAPIPGVQTLSFTPFSVPLSPFAGVLSNGASHTIGLSVYGANGYFSAAGALLVTLDPTTTTITGGVTHNDLADAPKMTIIPKLTQGNAATTGTLKTVGKHDFKIVGDIITSAGKITTTVTQTTKFENDQSFDITATKDEQNVLQTTSTMVDETSESEGGNSTETKQSYVYPLSIKYKLLLNAEEAGKQIVSINQQRQVAGLSLQNGQPSSETSSDDTTATTDILLLGPGFTLIGNEDQAETATLLTSGTNAKCFERVLTAANNVLTSATTGCSK
jgi:hypothetical protein